MAIAVFDTLATARKLKAAGIEDAQAEAHAEAIATAVTGGALATRADLAGLETRLTVRFYGIAAGIVAANTGLTVALLKLLP